MSERTGTRSVPVRANGLLLVVQAVGLAGIVVFGVWSLDWQWSDGSVSAAPGLPALDREAERAIITALVLVPPALLALVAALVFLFMLRAGWLLAMISQGATLLACLLLYASWAPNFIYPVMIYCAALALYLNSSTVRAAFFVRPRNRTEHADVS